MNRRLSALALASGFAVASCAGSSDPVSTAPDTSPPVEDVEEQTEPTDSSDTGTADDGDGDSDSDSDSDGDPEVATAESDAFCAASTALQESEFGTGFSDALFSDLIAAAPAEISDDVEIAIEGIRVLLDTDDEAIEELFDEEFDERFDDANLRVEQYLADNCEDFESATEEDAAADDAIADDDQDDDDVVGDNTTDDVQVSEFGALDPEPIDLLLTPDAVVGGGVPDATGLARLEYNGRSLEIEIATTTGDAPDIYSAAIHRGAAGETGDVVVDFLRNSDNTSGTIGVTSLDPARDEVLGELWPGIGDPSQYYVQVSSELFPDGIVRAQLDDMTPVPFPDELDEVVVELTPSAAPGGGLDGAEGTIGLTVAISSYSYFTNISYGVEQSMSRLVVSDGDEVLLEEQIGRDVTDGTNQGGLASSEFDLFVAVAEATGTIEGDRTLTFSVVTDEFPDGALVGTLG